MVRNKSDFFCGWGWNGRVLVISNLMKTTFVGFKIELFFIYFVTTLFMYWEVERCSMPRSALCSPFVSFACFIRFCSCEDENRNVLNQKCHVNMFYIKLFKFFMLFPSFGDAPFTVLSQIHTLNSLLSLKKIRPT